MTDITQPQTKRGRPRKQYSTEELPIKTFDTGKKIGRPRKYNTPAEMAQADREHALARYNREKLSRPKPCCPHCHMEL